MAYSTQKFAAHTSEGWEAQDQPACLLVMAFFLTGAKIQQQLAKIYNNVKKLQHQLKDAKPTPDCK